MNLSHAPASPPAAEQELLTAAGRGDEEAFGALLEPRRAELLAHCYRMLGSAHDAEDAMQEVLLRAWRGLPGFEGRSSLRSWLYRIATNTCLSMLDKRPKRVLPIDYGPAFDPHGEFGEHLSESVWLEPILEERLGVSDGPAAPEATYEQRESIELAFIAALQHLPGNQRAALILREVLGFSAGEVAETLETTTASVNSALQRARKIVDERMPEQSQQETLRELGDGSLGVLVEDYVRALEEGDVDTLLALLTEDATRSMPPTPTWYQGPEALAAFLAGGPFTVRWRHLVTHANGQPAVAGYIWSAERERYVAYVLDVLTLRGGRISAVTAFLDGEILGRFGLPAELPA